METSIEERHQRLKDAPWRNQSLKVNLIGAGTIGSWTALLLERAFGEKMTLKIFDEDTVETHNLGGQLYSGNSIDVNKTKAIRKIIKQFNTVNIYENDIQHIIENSFMIRSDNVINLSFIEHYHPVITISAVDNMETRKLLFETWRNQLSLRQDNSPSIFIDGRLSPVFGQIYKCENNNDAVRYEKSLFKDSDIEDVTCSFKSTSHSGALIGSLITGLVCNIITNYNLNVPVATTPFLTEFDLTNYKIKTYE